MRHLTASTSCGGEETRTQCQRHQGVTRLLVGPLGVREAMAKLVDQKQRADGGETAKHARRESENVGETRRANKREWIESVRNEPCAGYSGVLLERALCVSQNGRREDQSPGPAVQKNRADQSGGCGQTGQPE